MKSEFYRREQAAFFSYSRKDKDLAGAILGWLKSFARLNIWLDEKELSAGQV